MASPTSPLTVAVAGANGRMGQEVVKAVTQAPDMELVATINSGDDLAVTLNQTKPRCVVDFTVPGVVKANIKTALDCGVVPLVGTTGLSPHDLEDIRGWCQAAGLGVLVAPNFAIGAVLLMQFAQQAARYLPDVEIIEMHHERKVDAPSGTAVKTAELIAKARAAAEVSPLPAPVDAFETFTGARGGKAAGEVPVHSIRLPGFVASQEVIFGGPGQRLSLRHDSIDRASFMPGVLLAIRHASTLPGLVYGLEHLL